VATFAHTVVVSAFLQATAASVLAQQADTSVRVSITYSGRSLGALGAVRSQDEHELLTEAANTARLAYRLVSHAAWRAPGITIFLPSDEPVGDELPGILAALATAARRDSVPALRSNTVLLVQDPARPLPDLLALLERNPRRWSEFPDLQPTHVSVSTLRPPGGKPTLIVEESGAEWPTSPAGWTVGEMNRIDVAIGRVFELPVNLGEVGPRATVLERLAGADGSDAPTLLVDLGHRDGALGLARPDRARVDYAALEALGYSLVVPYEFELALGLTGLKALQAEFPSVGFLAANLTARDTTLFDQTRLVRVDPVTIGVFGLVAPSLETELPRASLDDFTFESPIAAAERAVATLRQAGATAIVALSNMDPADNARLAGSVAGIDAIVADLHRRGSPEAVRSAVVLPNRPWTRPGSPALVARGFADGVGVGRLDLVFHAAGDSAFHLARVEHELQSVTDRTPADTALVARLRALAQVTRIPKGDLMVPAFVDHQDAEPSLAGYDYTTAQGRISKPMWEAFLARLLRTRGAAEVAVIRPLPHFPPLIGKLHENEVRSWLWTEDEIVLLDLQGADLRALLAQRSAELVVSGIDPRRMLVGGRRLDDAAFYRVATTDVLFEGAGSRSFARGRRVRRRFRIDAEGRIRSDGAGGTLALRDFVLNELKRLRVARRQDHTRAIAQLLAPDTTYRELVTLTFDHPTLWTSFNQVYRNQGYGAVPESRVTAADAWVVGAGGRFVLSREQRGFATDLGLTVAYTRQSATLPTGESKVSESADDVKLDLTFRPTAGGRARTTVIRPFARALFDTEFTPTVDFEAGVTNPRQVAVQGGIGLMLPPTWRRRAAELGVVVYHDFAQDNVQYGLQGRWDIYLPLGPLSRVMGCGTTSATSFRPPRTPRPIWRSGTTWYTSWCSLWWTSYRSPWRPISTSSRARCRGSASRA
jgi:hypothetical protein